MNDRTPFRVRPATPHDAPVLAKHRVVMFRDMGRIADEATAADLRSVQLRPMLPRPGRNGPGILSGPEAYVLNVFVERDWRRREVAALLMEYVVGYARERRIRVVTLHASDDGRPLYERLGFVPTNEMRLG